MRPLPITVGLNPDKTQLVVCENQAITSISLEVAITTILSACEGIQTACSRKLPVVMNLPGNPHTILSTISPLYTTKLQGLTTLIQEHAAYCYLPFTPANDPVKATVEKTVTVVRQLILTSSSSSQCNLKRRADWQADDSSSSAKKPRYAIIIPDLSSSSSSAINSFSLKRQADWQPDDSSSPDKKPRFE